MVRKESVVEGYPGKSETRIQPTNFFLKFPRKGKNYGTMSELKPQDGTVLIYEDLTLGRSLGSIPFE
jgi:hypothetical protein